MLVEADLIIRQDTAANWATNNPILQNGQEGFETDTRKSKVGKGVAWNNTDYRAGGKDPIKSIPSTDTSQILINDDITVILAQNYALITGVEIEDNTGQVYAGIAVKYSKSVGAYTGFAIPGYGSIQQPFIIKFVAQ